MAEVAGGITVATIECDGEIVCEAPAIAHEKLGFVSGSCNSSTSAEEERRARVAWLEQLRRQCGSEQEFETARSQPTWTQVASTSSCSAECGPSSAELERLRVENKLHFQRLVETHPLPPDFHPFEDGWNEFDNLGRTSSFFFDFGGRLETGRKIGGGGQAEIYEALFDGEVDEYHVLKVFRSDYSLAELQRQWMTEIGSTSMLWKSWDGLYLKVCFIRNGMLLEDGRFAFVMRRHWGDLRKAIDLQIVKDKTHQSPPFPLSVSIDIMHQIATGMRRLHANDILHRDLKAANVLVNKECGKGIEEENFDSMQLLCYVADFESCEGVMGTGFWRAPEVLLALKSKGIDKFSDGRIWTKKVDVYSYAMTCYEVLTGCIPFQNRVANDYDSIIEGERPPLPDYVDHEMQNLLERCWHCVPSIRPTFDEICGELDTFISKKRKV